MRSAAPPLLPIFRSDAQARLLTELYLRHGDGRPISQVAAAAGVPLPSAHRELVRLITAGLVHEQRVGRQRLVTANQDGPYYEPLRTLLDGAFGPPTVLGAALADLPGLRFAALYGSYAARRSGEPGPPPNDLDLLLVGDVDPAAVYDAIATVGAQLALPVNPTIFSEAEWTTDTGFTRQLRARPLVPVLQHEPT